MAASQPGTFNVQEFTNLGVLAVGGRIYTYAQGTTTQKTAYTNQAGTTPHTYTSDGIGGQYIALDARGELPAPLYLTTGSYDIAYKDSTGATIWTRRADPTADVALPPFAYAATTPTFPTFGFSGGAGTGMYSPGPNQIAWSTGNVRRMLLDSNGTLTIDGTSAGNALAITATGLNPGIFVQGFATAGQSFGAQFYAGTNSSDEALLCRNAAGTTTLFRVRGDGELFGRGIATSRVKTATATITNNSTLTIDSFLQASLPIGRYGFELWVPVWATAANSLKWAMAFSGVSANFFYSAQYTSGGTPNATAIVAPGALTFAPVVSASAAGADWLKVEGSLTVTATGVLSFQEAQNTSNANAINIGENATMKVWQLS